METKTCETCGEQFDRNPGVKQGRWDKRRFCSRRCAAQRFRVEQIEKPCLTCGQPIKGYPYRVKQQKYCSLECQPRDGASNPNWKNGGRFKLPGGYWGRLIYPDHPFYAMGAKRGPRTRDARHVLEHRLVMAESLGRPLERHETVHHKNGDRTDNRLENLQLRSGKHGNGIVYRCRSCGSHDIEAREL